MLYKCMPTTEKPNVPHPWTLLQNTPTGTTFSFLCLCGHNSKVFRAVKLQPFLGLYSCWMLYQCLPKASNSQPDSFCCPTSTCLHNDTLGKLASCTFHRHFFDCASKCGVWCNMFKQLSSQAFLECFDSPCAYLAYAVSGFECLSLLCRKTSSRPVLWCSSIPLTTA